LTELPVRFYWVRRARWLKLHPQAAPDEKTEPITQVREVAVVA
jgi:hypothetical protein